MSAAECLTRRTVRNEGMRFLELRRSLTTPRRQWKLRHSWSGRRTPAGFQMVAEVAGIRQTLDEIRDLPFRTKDEDRAVAALAVDHGHDAWRDLAGIIEHIANTRPALRWVGL